MSSNPLIMGYEGGDLTDVAIMCCLCWWSGRAEPVCAGCGQWPERRRSSDQWREHIRGVYTWPWAIQIDVLYRLPLSLVGDTEDKVNWCFYRCTPESDTWESLSWRHKEVVWSRITSIVARQRKWGKSSLVSAQALCEKSKNYQRGARFSKKS